MRMAHPLVPRVARVPLCCYRHSLLVTQYPVHYSALQDSTVQGPVPLARRAAPTGTYARGSKQLAQRLALVDTRHSPLAPSVATFHPRAHRTNARTLTVLSVSTILWTIDASILRGRRRQLQRRRARLAWAGVHPVLGSRSVAARSSLMQPQRAAWALLSHRALRSWAHGRAGLADRRPTCTAQPRRCAQQAGGRVEASRAHATRAAENVAESGDGGAGDGARGLAADSLGQPARHTRAARPMSANVQFQLGPGPRRRAERPSRGPGPGRRPPAREKS